MATRSADQPVALAMDAVGSQMFSQENTRSGVTARRSAMYWMPLERILDNPYQPRQRYAADYVVSLAQSIADLKRTLPATLGLQQVPLARVVTVDGAGVVDLAPRLLYGDESEMRRLLNDPSTRVQLMFGHRRLRAFQVLASGVEAVFGPTSLKGPEPDVAYGEMPVMLQFAMDADVWRMAMTENSQREGLSAIEEANALQRAIDEFGWTLEEAGRPFGYRNRSSVSNKLRLLKLPESVQVLLAAGEISERIARELLRMDADETEKLQVAQEAAQRGSSVRDVAYLVDNHNAAKRTSLEFAARRAASEAATAEPERGQSLDALPVVDSATEYWPPESAPHGYLHPAVITGAAPETTATLSIAEAWDVWNAAFEAGEPAWDDVRLWQVLLGRSDLCVSFTVLFNGFRELTMHTQATIEDLRQTAVRELVFASAPGYGGRGIEVDPAKLARVIGVLKQGA